MKDLRPYKIEKIEARDPETGDEFWYEFADAFDEVEAGHIASRAFYFGKKREGLTEDDFRVKYDGKVIA